MTLEQVISDINSLKSDADKRLGKANRNFNKYQNNGTRYQTVTSSLTTPIYGTAGSQEYDTGPRPVVNVITSIIDTIVSKMSQAKVFPFFNPTNGSFKTIQVCRAAESYMESFIPDQKLYTIAPQILKEALIFDFAGLWIDDETKSYRPIKYWQLLRDGADFQYNKENRIGIWLDNYPLVELKDKIKDNPVLKERLEKNPNAKVAYVVYWDMQEKIKYEFADTPSVQNSFIKKSNFDYDTLPIITIHFTPPIIGQNSFSITDQLWTIQRFIDQLMDKLKIAAVLSPANTIWAPRGAIPKITAVSNQIANIYEYEISATNGAPPIQIMTPAPISPMYMEILNTMIQMAYQITGVSQLSAQSRKPSGLNSGVAIQTMEDVESERFNSLLLNYIQFMEDIIKKTIQIFPKNELIMPTVTGRPRITWGDLRSQEENFEFQLSPSTFLSRDPMTKMEQIEKLFAMKLLPADSAAQYLELPDLDRVYGIITASYDYCLKIIERAITKEDYDFYNVVDMNQLYSITSKTLMRLDEADEDKIILDKVYKLLKIVKGKLDSFNAAVQDAQAQEQANIKPPQVAGPTGPLPAAAPMPPNQPQTAPQA